MLTLVIGKEREYILLFGQDEGNIVKAGSMNAYKCWSHHKNVRTSLSIVMWLVLSLFFPKSEHSLNKEESKREKIYDVGCLKE